MHQALQIIQVITAILLITFVLLQNQGAGVGGVFGGDSNIHTTKRGAEKLLHIFTIILSMLFLVVSLVITLAVS